jgi:hypothetical protein
MKSRRKLLIIGGLALLLIFVIVTIITGTFRQDTRGDDKEPERGGPQVVAIENTEKLNAILPAPQFFAVKNNISTYIQQRISPAVTKATIEDTQLDQNGTVTIRVAADKTAPFTASIYQSNGQLVFQVAATGYTAADSISNLTDQYGASYD